MLLSSEIVIDESINDADIRKALQHAGAAALCQPAAENGEKNHAAIDGEPRQRDFAFGFVHTPTLSQSRDASVARRQLAHRLFQVLEAAEEGEVVPGGGLVLRRDELLDRCQQTAAMAEARRDIARDVHCQLFRLERRGIGAKIEAMKLWEKLTYDPDMGPRIRSPLPAGIAGLGLIFSTLRSIAHGTVALGRGPDPAVVHFHDHPAMFVLMCTVFFILGAAALRYSRRQFLRHRDD